MITAELNRCVDLLQKAYSQPLIFHTLFRHIKKIMPSNFVPFDGLPLWKKVIFLSGTNNNNRPNQAVEIKLQRVISSLKELEDEGEIQLKILLICYYLISRPTKLINHILLFELVEKFIGITNFIDSLIILLLRRTVIGSKFGVDNNIKLRSDCIQKMVETINYREDLSENCRIMFLPCCIHLKSKIIFPVNPVIHKKYNQPLFVIKYIESLFFFLQHHVDPLIFSNELESLKVTVLPLMEAWGSNFLLIEKSPISENLLLQSQDVCFTYIKKLFMNSNNKEKLVNDVCDYLCKLLNEYK